MAEQFPITKKKQFREEKNSKKEKCEKKMLLQQNALRFFKNKILTKKLSKFTNQHNKVFYKTNFQYKKC